VVKGGGGGGGGIDSHISSVACSLEVPGFTTLVKIMNEDWEEAYIRWQWWMLPVGPYFRAVPDDTALHRSGSPNIEFHL
jgi:hypothetical protein